jgi:hypothetical protein
MVAPWTQRRPTGLWELRADAAPDAVIASLFYDDRLTKARVGAESWEFDKEWVSDNRIRLDIRDGKSGAVVADYAGSGRLRIFDDVAGGPPRFYVWHSTRATWTCFQDQGSPMLTIRFGGMPDREYTLTIENSADPVGDLPILVTYTLYRQIDPAVG